MMYRPTELWKFLGELGVHPKKALSQNFLIDGNIIRKIVATAEVHAGDRVLEIGPGPGALTQALLEAGARVTAVEKDDLLAKALLRFKDRFPELIVLSQDILDLDEAALCCDPNRIKIIANLPYHITTPILTRLAPRCDLFESITVMVQKEVAERMTAQAGSAAYGSLSVFLQFHGEPSYAFTVSRQCFTPVPKVESAVVHLRLRPPPLPAGEGELFFQLTRRAFEQRRKMLRSSLRELYGAEQVERALEQLAISSKARPEELSLAQFLDLFHKLHANSN